MKPQQPTELERLRAKRAEVSTQIAEALARLKKLEDELELLEKKIRKFGPS